MLDFRKEDVIIQPKVHKFTIIFLPGWSRSAETDWNVFKSVPILKNSRIRIIQSPHRASFENSKVQLPSWYIHDLRMTYSFLPGLQEISKMIEEIMQEEYELCQQMFLGGFSQGGFSAFYTAFAISKIPFLGVFCLSSYIAVIGLKKDRTDIPVFVYHGGKDEILSSQICEVTLEMAKKRLSVTDYLEPGLGHTYTWKEFVKLKKWMESCVKIEKL